MDCFFCCVLFFLLLAHTAHCIQPLLQVRGDHTGRISVSVEHQAWLDSSALPWIQSGLLPRTLALVSTSQVDGTTDGLGDYTAQAWEWADSVLCKGRTALKTELRHYHDLPNVAIFEQSFPCGVASVQVGVNTSDLASAWPAFQEIRQNLSWVTFNGHFAANVDRGIGLSTCKIGMQGGPLMLYDEITMNTIVVSQFTRLKTGEMNCSNGLSLGIKGTVTSIPVGFSASWIIQAGNGISKTMEQWGNALLAVGKKRRTDVYQDDIVGSLGYWTDNGAYYHYPVTGPTTLAGGYQSEMTKVHEANLADGLPFRHWQLDSWWYQKGHGGNGSSRGQGDIGPPIGVYEWVTDPFVFPDGGLPSVQRIVGLPFVLHNRWFSPENWYRNHSIPASGWTEVVNATQGVLPLDGDAFWEYFFSQQKGYGLKVYEQDFLYLQYEIVPALQQNATLADDWLRAMADAARAHNLTMQYCMPFPRDYMASTQHQAVTTIRPTDDYAPNNPNWRIGRQSLLAHAVGLLPFKDTFLSGGSKESGAANPGPELTPELHTLVSVLSGAMVGPGDGPHLANRSLLLQACMQDGVLLKPDRPAIPVDVAWTSLDPGGELTWSLSSLPDGRSHRYVLAAALDHDYELKVSDVDLSQHRRFVARNWYTGDVRPFSAGSPLLLSTPVGSDGVLAPVSFQYWSIAEVLHGWALLGELSKFIPTSTRRISSVTVATDGSLNVDMSGVGGERVSVCAIQCSGACVAFISRTSCETVILDTDGNGTVSFKSAEELEESVMI